MNQLLRILLRAFAGFEKKLTKSDTEKSIAVKILVAQVYVLACFTSTKVRACFASTKVLALLLQKYKY